MSLRIITTLGLLSLAIVGMAARSDASTVDTIPPDLSPGDTYRLVFITADTANATSTSIAAYNTFVTDQADDNSALAALGATWTCICSTATANAVDIVGITTSGIYTLDGNEVANGTAALFNASSTNLIDPINIDQNGDLLAGALPVWTGTLPDGSSVVGNTLGETDPVVGIASETNLDFLDDGGMGRQSSLYFYGISSELTVPSPTPEPSTLGLSALGGALLLLARRYKQRNQISKGS